MKNGAAPRTKKYAAGNYPRRASPGLLRRVARNMKRLRAERGMTQKQLSKRSGWSLSYITKIENARVNASLAALEALSLGLGCEDGAIVARRSDRARAKRRARTN